MKWPWSFLRRRKDALIYRLPPLSGAVSEDVSLARKTWFGVGGAAEVYIEPADINDLSVLIKHLPNEPLTVLGAGSNVLVRDGGIPGIVVKLGKPFTDIQVSENKLICGAGALVMEVARVAEKNKISGFEFLCGIPGSVGGALRMNAGAHGQAVFDRLERLTAVTGAGEVVDINPHEMDVFSYRQCHLPTDWIFVEAVFRGDLVTDAEVIREKMVTYKKHRESSQPQGVRTAGSTFKNPEGLAAWRLIEKAGMKGARVGGAIISDKHANFIINTGSATANDIEVLGEQVRRAVLKKCGVTLEWEVKKLGVDQK